MTRFTTTLAMLLLSFLLLPSCRTVQAPPQVMGENSWNREKDVVEFSIGLKGSLSAEAYLNWTQQHLEEKNLHSSNPGFPGIPVYEVKYYFFKNRGYRGGFLGTVLWRRDPQQGNRLVHVSTILERGS